MAILWKSLVWAIITRASHRSSILTERCESLGSLSEMLFFMPYLVFIDNQASHTYISSVLRGRDRALPIIRLLSVSKGD